MFEIHSSRDKRVRQQLRKQRRATMSRGSLRSVRRDVSLMLTLKSNLAVELAGVLFFPPWTVWPS